MQERGKRTILEAEFSQDIPFGVETHDEEEASKGDPDADKDRGIGGRLGRIDKVLLHARRRRDGGDGRWVNSAAFEQRPEIGFGSHDVAAWQAGRHVEFISRRAELDYDHGSITTEAILGNIGRMRTDTPGRTARMVPKAPKCLKLCIFPPIGSSFGQAGTGAPVYLRGQDKPRTAPLDLKRDLCGMLDLLHETARA